MDIKSYVESKGGTAKRDCPVMAKLATDAECSPETLYMITLGHKKASALLSRRLSSASGDVVAPGDLRPDIFGPAPGKAAKKRVA